MSPVHPDNVSPQLEELRARVKVLETRVKGLEDAILEVDRVVDDADVGPHFALKVRLMIAAALEKAGRGPTALDGPERKDGE